MSDEDRAIYERFKREGYGDSLPRLAELVQHGQFTWKRLALLIMGPEPSSGAAPAREEET